MMKQDSSAKKSKKPNILIRLLVLLITAALVVGAAWGALYRFFPNRFAAIILSHAVWDVAVFIFFPI